MRFINNNELERNVDDDIIKVKTEDLIACDQDLELIELGRNCISLHSNVSMMPLIVLNASSPWQSILVIVEHAVHVGPFFNCSLPMLQSRERCDD